MEHLYHCADGNFIHCYHLTSKYLFVVESPIENPQAVVVKYCNIPNKYNMKNLTYPILLSISNIENRDSGFSSTVRSLNIVNVPTLLRGKLEIVYFMVINTNDGVQICSLEELLSNDNELVSEGKKRISKWKHDQHNDSITCIYAQGYKYGSIVVTYGTTLCNIVQFRFDTSKKRFSRIKLPKQLNQTKEQMTDSISSISGIRLGMNYPTSENESLWSSLSSTEVMSFTNLDNTLYSIIEGKLEKVPFYSDTEEQTENQEQTVIWGDFAVTKKYSTSSTMYFVVNIINLGCILYKRSNRGQWDKLNTFKRDIKTPEVIFPLDCYVFLRQHSNELIILSGSESGKLYRWSYNYRDEYVSDSEIYEVNNLDIDSEELSMVSIIHSLSVLADEKVYFLSENNTSIGYINI